MLVDETRNRSLLGRSFFKGDFLPVMITFDKNRPERSSRRLFRENSRLLEREMRWKKETLDFLIGGMSLALNCSTLDLKEESDTTLFGDDIFYPEILEKVYQV